MTHADLLHLALSVHFAIFAGSLAAWYKYGDRSDVFVKSLAGTDSALSRLRMMISDDLLAAIKGHLSKVTYPTNPSLLGLDGKTPIYSEKVANFLDSEAFRDTFREFVGSAGSLSDYRVLMRAREKWCFWGRMLSWSILISIVLQIVFLVTHGFFDYILGYSLQNWVIHATLAISGFMVLSVFCLPFPILLRSHDVILELRVKYDAP